MFFNFFVKGGNVSLRMVTLISKFVVLAILIKYFPASEIALYGLFTATVSYCLYIIGFDFYLFSGREISASSENRIGSLLKFQMIFYLSVYLILLPFVISIFNFDILPAKYIHYFFILIITEHFSQEIYRYLVVVQKQIQGTLVLFIRSGLWCLLYLVYVKLFNGNNNLSLLFSFWVGGSLLSTIVGVFFVLRGNVKGWKDPLDVKWLKRGVRISFPYFVGTMLFQGMYTFDKYILKLNFDDFALSSYVIYLSFSNAIITFLEAGGFVFYYPRLLKLSYDEKKFKIEFKKMFFGIMSLCVVLLVLSIFCIGYVLKILGKEEFLGNNLKIYYVLLISVLFQTLSSVAHYGLYALSKDKLIAKANIFGTSLFFPIALILSKVCGEIGVSISIATVFIILTIIKWRALIRVFDENEKMG